jgi:2-polyprenyl-3-methyl-5-hydroxy-6-metoxy-1,4-benzoquinol methylase
MIDLSQRSQQKELMDADNIPFAAMSQTLKELNIVNTRLGGHAITMEGVRKLAGNTSSLIVCEIGCGGGDNLFALCKYCSEKNIPSRFIGIDINPECIAFAKQQYSQMDCEWICSDYSLADLSKDQPDIIFSSLFCHHFSNEQLIQMLQWLDKNSKAGFFINDLHRHWLAYYLIKYITKFFSRSYLVKNDASLSVARSFKKKEWKALFQQAVLPMFSIHWKWAFRWLVISKKNKAVER